MTRSPSRLAGALLTAHHPVCTVYAQDWVRFGRLRVCQGCLATWPTFLLSLPLAWHLALKLPPGTTPLGLAAAGLVFGLPQGLTVLTRLARPQRWCAKLLGGFGLALLLAGAWIALPPTYLLEGVIVLACGFTLLLALRMRTILQTCKACPWAMDWEACPGMLARGRTP